MANPSPQTTTAPQDAASDSDTSADSDFYASPSPAGSAYNSSSDEDGTKKPKRKTAEDEKLASGDEGVVVDASRKKRRKKGKKGKKVQFEDAGEVMDIDREDDGVGARLRRRKDKIAERKVDTPSASTDQPITIDVDEIWTRMNRSLNPNDYHTEIFDSDKENLSSSQQPENTTEKDAQISQDNMITIEYHHTFAGETTTEKKLVHKDSAEARLHLQSRSQDTTKNRPTSKHLPENGKPMRRPLLQKSKFDTGEYANISTSLAKWKLDRKKEQGQKMTTVEKSKLDWAKHVDEQGMREELDAAGKSKGRYLDRMDFLDRSAAVREDELRKERIKGL